MDSGVISKVGRWSASTWPPKLLNLKSSVSSALFELYPIIVAATLCWKEWASKSIHFHCDNSAAVHCINKGRSSSTEIMPFLRRLIWTSACNQFIIKAVYMPGCKTQLLTLFPVLSFRNSEIISSSGRPVTHTSASLFGPDLPVNHPLLHLHNLSTHLILQGVSPRTLSSYWMAWNGFKTFHSHHKLQFPDFSLTTVSSFANFLHHFKQIQPGSIKTYLSSIHYFHKQIFGRQCPAINNPQLSLFFNF